MNREEQIAYDRYWMDRAILKNTMFTVRGEGLMEGQRLEKIQNARKMKELGVEVQVISQVTGLSFEEISKL